MSDPSTPGPAPAPVPYRVALRTWLYIGLNSFGGPAGQIAVMHRVLVDEKKWISDQRFLHALNYCMLLPGPEATQLATYIGWLMHRTRGGLTAGILFVLPGFLSLLLLSILYTTAGDLGFVAALFFGLKPAVLAVVVNFVELLCTAGLPAIYTAVLTQHALSPLAHYGYLGLYNAAYIFDDALMVTIAVATLGRHKLEEREGRWLKLISGAVMIGLGLLLVVKPALI